jgi:hypothetical protein
MTAKLKTVEEAKPVETDDTASLTVLNDHFGHARTVMHFTDAADARLDHALMLVSSLQEQVSELDMRLDWLDDELTNIEHAIMAAQVEIGKAQHSVSHIIEPHDCLNG